MYKKSKNYSLLSFSTLKVFGFVIFVVISLYILNSSISQVVIIRNAFIASVYEIVGFIYTPIEVLVYGEPKSEENHDYVEDEIDALKVENFRLKELVEALKFQHTNHKLLFTTYIARYESNDSSELFVATIPNNLNLPSETYAISGGGVIGKCEKLTDKYLGIRYISSNGMKTVAYIPELKMHVILQGEGIKSDRLKIVTPDSITDLPDSVIVVTSADSLLFRPDIVIGKTHVINGKPYVLLSSKASDNRFVSVYTQSR